ncbi:hypothetical protein AVEN_230050-1 [Araneus ventricosus]|uniref:Uncharacterized protein n=1 Tax=Araneus ventricosus TaxID=182803 RepID=A0A4Y2CUX8_ARAVE|nr:hypothetical protein AVEN_230050-1 [Araneus ventricosus]
MKPRHLNCLAHFGDPPDGSIDVRESVYMYLYKEKIAREHLTGPQHYPDNGLVSGTRGKVSRNQEEEDISRISTVAANMGGSVILTSVLKHHEGYLGTDLAILNRGQMTRKTPKLVPPSPSSRPPHAGEALSPLVLYRPCTLLG